jgi:hypothetical protein
MASPIDKYAHDSISPLGRAWDDLPPDPAAPMPGEDAVLQLYAPKDHTLLDLGAGSTPGIRMATDQHVHLTARGTLTTISLGSAGGAGISKADPEGLQVFTAGEKHETVEKAVVEVYKDTKSETVLSTTEEKYLAAKTEIISGFHTQKLFDEHHFGVKKDAVYDFDANKSERIVGDWKVEVMGKKHETIHGDRSWLSKGKWLNVTIGAYNDLHLGEKLTATFAANVTLHMGASISASLAFQKNFVAGNKHEVVLGNGFTMNQTLKVTVDNIKADKAEAAYKDIATEMKTGQLEVFKRTYGITSSQMTIFK